jgi:Ca2+-binding RTX toxin-like protein
MSDINFTGLDEKKDWVFDAMNASVRQQSANEVVYQDNTTGDRWTVEGFGLQVDQVGNLTGGTVTLMEHADKKGDVFLTCSDFLYNIPADKPLFEVHTGISLFVTQFDDDIQGSKDDDYLNAGQGSDFIFANKGNDDLRGEVGNDILKGGGGKDFLWAGGGDDYVTGGGGKDIFKFLIGDGHDTITDFSARKDVFEATWANVDAITQVGNDTLIDFGDGDMLTLIDVNANEINQGLFTF